MKQKCKFINLRDAITLFPDDKKLLGLANRFHNFQAIRNDLRKAHNLLGEVIRFQNQEKLLTSPHLFSAGWFLCRYPLCPVVQVNREETSAY